ncbi:MAG: AAA family ATPase, partial [Bacteroidota bacterium]
MDNTQIHIELKNIRAVEKANIILDGITVIAGENGSGKSTISKLTYHLLKTSIEFDGIVDGEQRNSLYLIYQTLNQLTMELSYFLEEDEYRKIRNTFRKFRAIVPLSSSKDDNNIFSAIDYLIDKFDAINILLKTPKSSKRFKRIPNYLLYSFESF